MSSSSCEPNSNVAGPGVIGAFITTAMLTVLLSWWQIIRVQIRVANQYTGERRTTYRIQSRRLKKALPAAINGFGVAQIVTGFALLAGTARKYGGDLTDKHAVMAAAIILLAIASSLPPMAAIIRASGMPHWSILIRLAIGAIEIVAFIVFIFTGKSSDVSPLSGVTTFLKAVTLILVGCEVVNIFIGVFSTLGGQTILVIVTNWGTRAVAFTSSLFAIILCGIIIFLKANASICDFNNPEDNEMSFGQFFTILLLASPILSFVESLFLTEEEKRTLKHEYLVLGKMSPPDEA